MSYIFPYIIILFVAVISSADIPVDVKKCKEQVITKCQCGELGYLTDVYVDGCQVVSNESSPCQPCQGSCQLFLNCKICSKFDCFSCPIGKTGPYCDKDETLLTRNETISENTQIIYTQNVTESPLLETTNLEVSNGNLNGTLPKNIISDDSRIIIPLFELTAESNRPEIKLDSVENSTEKTSIVEVTPEENPFENITANDNENIIDFSGIRTSNCSNNTKENTTENTSIVGVIPEEKQLENISTKDNETLIDFSEICTSNCSNNTNKTTNNSFVNLVDDDNGNNFKNVTGTFELDDNLELGNPQWKKSTNTSSESREILYESQPLRGQDFDDVQQHQFSGVNIPLNISTDWEKDYASYNESGVNDQLMKHRSPNPLAADDSSMIDSSYENNDKENLQYEQDQQVLEVSENDYSEKSFDSDTQENIEDIKNQTGTNLQRSILKSENNTVPKTKYVYLNTYDLPNDEDESKYPDVVSEESSQSEEDSAAVNETDNIHAVHSEPDQKYDFSKPHLLKQHFDSKEDENPKPEVKVPDLWRNLCTVFNVTSVCRSHASTADDRNTLHPRHNPHAHIEHTISYFRSPEFPGNKLLFPDANDAPKMVPVDLIKLRSMTNSDSVQQEDDYLYDSLPYTHRPIPQSLNVYNQPTNPPQTFFLNQGYAMNQSPGPSKDNNFQKDLFSSLFDHLLHLIGPHIPPYQDRSFSGEKREYGPSSGVLQNEQLPRFQSLNVFPQQIPGQTRVPQNLFSNYNFQSMNNGNPFMPFNFQDTDLNSIFPDQPRVPVVKGHIIIANIANENGTEPQIVPGSIRSQDFEFEIPMMMPPSILHPDNKESRKSKSNHPKHSKGMRRLKKLHKRRRNGVKNNAANASNKCDPWKEDCTKNIDSHASFSGRKVNHNTSSKTLKKDQITPDKVFLKFMEILSDGMNIPEKTTTSKSNELNEKNAHLKANESIIQHQDDLVTERIVDDISQASDESNSDSESNRPRFRVRRSASHFCPIPKDSRNGDIDCTIWTYKKKCTLTCHPGYTNPNQHFTCSRSTNTWMPPLTACIGPPEFEPDDNTIQLKHLADLPENLADEDEDVNKSPDHEETSHEYSVQEHSEEEEGEDHEESEKHEESNDHEEAGDHEEVVNHVESDSKATTPKKKVKKAHVNSVKIHEESMEETEHVHKSHKSHSKSEKPKHQHHKGKKTELKEEQPKKEEHKEVVEHEASNDIEEELKESYETHSEEESPIDEASAASTEDQEVEENDLYSEYDEPNKRK